MYNNLNKILRRMYMKDLIRELVFKEAKHLHDNKLPTEQSYIKRLEKEVEYKKQKFYDDQQFVIQAIQKYGFIIVPSRMGDGFPPELIDPVIDQPEPSDPETPTDPEVPTEPEPIGDETGNEVN
jgi:rubrerythrin